MLSHVFVGVTDFHRAFHFYSGVMPELALQLKFSDEINSWAGWVAVDQPRPLFLIGRPFNGAPASAGNGQMIALLASDRAMVRQVYAKAIQLGATCEGAPGQRPQYHADYYGAYFRDLDGNKLCVCCHSPE